MVFREKLTIDKFEEIGRRLDEEVTRLFQYIEVEAAPETERRTASFLRTVSAKLTEAAAVCLVAVPVGLIIWLMRSQPLSFWYP